MPDVPRDPRQLARDILSGKVRIEDLQRERQMQRPSAPQARVPLPRTAPPPRPAPQARPPAQRMPQMPQRQQPQRQPQRPIPQQRQPQRPQYTVAAPPPPPPRPVAPVLEPAPETMAAPKPARRSLRLNDLVRSKHALRQGILLAEVLGKPVSLREEQF